MKLKTNHDVYTAFAEGRVKEAYNKRTGVKIQGNFLYGPDGLLAVRLGSGRLFLVDSQRLTPRFTREAFSVFFHLRDRSLPAICLNFNSLRSYGFNIEAFEPLEFYEFLLSRDYDLKDSAAVVRHHDQTLVLTHQRSAETCAAYLVSSPKVAHDVARTAIYAPSRDALFCGGVWLVPLPKFASDIFSSGTERYKHFRIPRTCLEASAAASFKGSILVRRRVNPGLRTLWHRTVYLGKTWHVVIVPKGAEMCFPI